MFKEGHYKGMQFQRFVFNMPFLITKKASASEFANSRTLYQKFPATSVQIKITSSHLSTVVVVEGQHEIPFPGFALPD